MLLLLLCFCCCCYCYCYNYYWPHEASGTNKSTWPPSLGSRTCPAKMWKNRTNCGVWIKLSTEMIALRASCSSHGKSLCMNIPMLLKRTYQKGVMKQARAIVTKNESVWSANIDSLISLKIVYRVWQKSGPLKYLAVFSATVWDYNVKIYKFTY